MFNRLISAFLALWHGLVSPQRVKEATTESAVAIFAAAVLVLTVTSTITAFVEAGDPMLAAESSSLLAQGTLAVEPGGVDLNSPQRHFTAVFGGALIRSVMSVVVLAGAFLFLGRFLTDQAFRYPMALAAVSSAILIDVVKAAVETPLHLMLHTARAGLHLGAFTSPTQHPFLFWWLQRFDLFGLWQYVAIAIALVSFTDLHPRYGIVVGVVVFLAVQIAFGGFSLVAWITSLGM